MTDIKDINNRFAYHPPVKEYVRTAHETVRAELLRVAVELDGHIPEGREKALFFTKLEEAMMWANAGIARNQE